VSKTLDNTEIELYEVVKRTINIMTFNSKNVSEEDIRKLAIDIKAMPSFSIINIDSAINHCRELIR